MLRRTSSSSASTAVSVTSISSRLGSKPARAISTDSSSTNDGSANSTAEALKLIVKSPRSRVSRMARLSTQWVTRPIMP